LYFAGIGKEIARSEPILLLQDFGNDFGPLLRGTVSVNNLVYGLSPTERQLEIARTQLFFIDSSRTDFTGALRHELANSTPVFDATVLGIDDRCAPIFYASQSGGRAFGIKGEQSLFSAALLKCLDGAAAVPAASSSQPDSDHLEWEVTTSSLIDGLDSTLRAEKRAKNEEFARSNVTPEYAVGGVVRDALIHRLEQPPSVAVSLQSEILGAPIDILNEFDDVVTTVTPKDHTPIEITLPAGFYRAVVRDGAPDAARRPRRTKLVKPARYEWKVKA